MLEVIKINLIILHSKLLLFKKIYWAICGNVRGHINYRKVSDIKRTKSKNLNDSRLVLKLSVPNPLKLGIKSRMKM